MKWHIGGIGILSILLAIVFSGADRAFGNDLQIPASTPAVVSLNGDWAFAYDGITEGRNRFPGYAASVKVPEFPADQDYDATMRIPGYWDDYLPRLQNTVAWYYAQFNSTYRPIAFPMGSRYVPPFETVLYLVGTGYYRRYLDLPDALKGKRFVLSLGGAVEKAKVYLNRVLVGEHHIYLTPADFDLSGAFRPGRNELIIAVTNRSNLPFGHPTSCAIDGTNGFTGGIFGDVALRISSAPVIRDVYVYPASGRLRWRAEISGFAAGSALRWSILDSDGETRVNSGEMALTHDGTTEWDTDASRLERWTEKIPTRYVLELRTVNGGEVCDQRRQRFGLRVLEIHGRSIYMNGKSLMLRGANESWYYPETTTAPIGKAAYVAMIKKFQELGFNWIRFHTSMPRQEYLEAADQLGMLIQVEGPRDSDEATWISMLKAARNHPSVILYCVSNEALMDDAMIAGVIRRHDLTREYAPDALFTPMEALRGIEYGAPGRADFEPGAVDTPFLSNPGRYKRVKPTADLIEATGWGHFSFNSAAPAKPEEINAQLDWFGDKPVLLHELGIHGTYLDLSLRDRYLHSRIGTGLYDAVRKYLDQNDLLQKANLYYRNSCRWAQLLRKHAIERARLCADVKGYDQLGPVDIHWMFTGYTCGIMNEFLELKPGESAQDVRNYNGESVLLTDLDTKREFFAGEHIKLKTFASLFGEQACEKGTYYWNLKNERGRILLNGEIPLGTLAAGSLHHIADLDLPLPDGSDAKKLVFSAKLLSSTYELQNRWSIWVFPKVPSNPGTSGKLRIVSTLGPSDIDYLKSGGRVLLLGTGPFHDWTTSFQVAAAGRVVGSQATIISDHPIFAGFPNDGCCDWQFYEMLSDGKVVVFDQPGIPFDPILEVASSYKLLKKEAAIFEARVGQGSLLVCALKLSPGDPAGRFLRWKLVRYASGDHFTPRSRIQPESLERLLK